MNESNDILKQKENFFIKFLYRDYWTHFQAHVAIIVNHWASGVAANKSPNLSWGIFVRNSYQLLLTMLILFDFAVWYLCKGAQI